ncbi:flagellar filament capping protein FliD [Pseudidiomarina andamanensis]|uniref:Flagellar hook-associated protein 2 n=1 Tax=Pseudidiomarina andamanensis TaxID=1940690 RepID=A0AA92EU62_9GAMM|nr:flagellar filament capping protein FliD [Pseudidiomarina andamanensis]MDS0218910.1 flagellar filament capping protein FliD [Pseudidiomarina andamanensis]QGT96274.1 flagellar hook protein [Pseudidiomarina andamanensis]
MASIAALGIGSGLDLNGLLNQLEAAERQRLQPISLQQKSFEARISAYGKLQSALTKFQDATSALNLTPTFKATKSSVNSDVLTVAAASNTPTGTFDVNVTGLARSYSIATQGVTDSAAQIGTGTGNVSLTLANGTTHSIDLADGATSLEDIRSAVNNAQTDVQASIINDGSGSPYRLVFSSASTGTDSAIADITFGGALAGNVATDVSTEVAASNATLSVNGVAITSQTNVVENAIQGVTLSLAKEGQAQVSITRDAESISGNVNDFVASFNELQQLITDMTKYDEGSQVAGQLLGDSGVRTIESRLRNLLSETVASQFTKLGDIGISRELGGKLKVDEEALANVVQNDLPMLQEFFAGTDTIEGFADKAKTTLSNLLADEGPINSRIKGFESTLERLDDRYFQEEQRIASTVEIYRKQFAQMDSMIASMNSTSAYLQQQFASLNAQLGQGN